MRAWGALVLGVSTTLVLVWVALLSAPFQANTAERVRELLAPSAIALGWTVPCGLLFIRTGKALTGGLVVRWAFASWSALALALWVRSGWQVTLTAESLIVAGTLAAPATVVSAVAFWALVRWAGRR